MKTMTHGTMMPHQRTNAELTTTAGKKHRMMPNHNVHVNTHHGKIMVGRKGRKS